MSIGTNPTTGVEFYDDENYEDLPDPPLSPKRTGGTQRELEVPLKRYRLKFNWDEPNENKNVGVIGSSNTIVIDNHGFVDNQELIFDSVPSGSGLNINQSYYVINSNSTANTFKVSTSPTIASAVTLSSVGSAINIATIDENDGLAPGQSPVFKYKVVVQKKGTAGSWQNAGGGTDGAEYTKNSYYIFHANPTDSDLSSVYRAKIYSVDKDGNESEAWLNSNNGKLIYPDGDEGSAGTNTLVDNDTAVGGATKKPDDPPQPTVKRRVKAVLVQWDDEQPPESSPVVFEIHAKLSKDANGNTIPWPDPPRQARIAQTEGSERLITRYWDGTALVDFVKKDWQKDFDFKLRAKNKIGTAITYSDNDSPSTKSKPARGPRAHVIDGAPDAPTNATAASVSPRRIMFRWQEPDEDESVARYKVEVLSSTALVTSYTGNESKFSTADTFHTRARHFRHSVPKTDLTKYWVAKVYSETAVIDQVTVPAKNEQNSIAVTGFNYVPSANETHQLTVGATNSFANINEVQNIAVSNFSVAAEVQQINIAGTFGSGDYYRIGYDIGIRPTVGTTSTATLIKVKVPLHSIIALPDVSIYPLYLRNGTAAAAELITVNDVTAVSTAAGMVVYDLNVTRGTGAIALTTSTVLYISSNNITYANHGANENTAGSVRSALTCLLGTDDNGNNNYSTNAPVGASSVAYNIIYSGYYSGIDMPLPVFQVSGCTATATNPQGSFADFYRLGFDIGIRATSATNIATSATSFVVKVPENPIIPEPIADPNFDSSFYLRNGVTNNAEIMEVFNVIPTATAGGFITSTYEVVRGALNTTPSTFSSSTQLYISSGNIMVDTHGADENTKGSVSSALTSLLGSGNYTTNAPAATTANFSYNITFDDLTSIGSGQYSYIDMPAVFPQVSLDNTGAAVCTVTGNTNATGKTAYYRIGFDNGMKTAAPISTAATFTALTVTEPVSPVITRPNTPFYIRNGNSTTSEVMKVNSIVPISTAAGLITSTYNVSRSALSTNLSTSSTNTILYLTSQDIIVDTHGTSDTISGSVRSALTSLLGSTNYSTNAPNATTSSFNYNVTFVNNYAEKNIPLINVQPFNCSVTSGTATAGTIEKIPSYKLSWTPPGSSTTTSGVIDFNNHNLSSTTGGSVRSALTQIIGNSNFSLSNLASTGTPSSTFTYLVDFTGAYAETPLTSSPLVSTSVTYATSVTITSTVTGSTAISEAKRIPSTAAAISNVAVTEEFPSGGATSAPSSLTSVTVKRGIKSLIVSWEDDQPKSSETVKYEIHVQQATKFTAAAFGTNTVTVANHGLTDGQRVYFVYSPALVQFSTAGTNVVIETYTVYYARLIAGNNNTFYLSTSPNGTNLNFALAAGSLNNPVIAYSKSPYYFYNDPNYFATASNFSGPGSLTRVGQSVSDSFVVTRYNDVLATNRDQLQTFKKNDWLNDYCVVVIPKTIINGVTTYGQAFQASGFYNPKKRITSNSATAGTVSTSLTRDVVDNEEDDFVEIIANRFIADDGTGDRIVIADSPTEKAKVKFIANNGNVTNFTSVDTGVQVSGGMITFGAGGGIRLPFVTGSGTSFPDLNTGATAALPAGELRFGRRQGTGPATSAAIWLKSGTTATDTGSPWVYFRTGGTA